MNVWRIVIIFNMSNADVLYMEPLPQILVSLLTNDIMLQIVALLFGTFHCECR